jgi:hypothetical protein
LTRFLSLRAPGSQRKTRNDKDNIFVVSSFDSAQGFTPAFGRVEEGLLLKAFGVQAEAWTYPRNKATASAGLSAREA